MATSDRIEGSTTRPVLGASIGVWHDDKLLGIERGNEPFKGLWSFPGGTVEAGETVETAVLRELREETGIRAEVTGLGGYLDVITNADGHLKHHFVVLIFAGRHVSGEAIAGDGVASVKWMEPDEFRALPTTPDFDQAITMAERFLVSP
ncbi:MAG: NUDIX hydrolase [Pseudomonadota bacterium]